MSKFIGAIGLSALLSMGLVLIMAGSPAGTDARSAWAAKPMTIDGLASDWGAEPMTVHQGTKTEISFRNDADDLYILLAFKDPKFLSTLEKSGITVYFNTRGEDKKDRGIKFTRLMLTSDQLIARRQGQGRKLTSEQIAAIKAKPFHTLLLYDIVNKKDRQMTMAAKPTLLPDFNAVKSGEVWTYEFKIPLARSENQPFGIGAEPGGNVRIGLEWGGRTEAVTEQENQFSRSMSDRDKPGQDAQIRKGAPKYTVWLAVTLASKS